MKILITGAGGMLGSDLCQALSVNFSVAGVGRSPAPHLAVPYFQQDLSKPGALAPILKSQKPDLVFHAAAVTHVDGCEKNREGAMRYNAGMTQSVAQACRDAGTFLIFFSTDYVFDGTKQGEYLENDPVYPLNIYGESKALAEKYIQQIGGPYAIFRISWLYGRHGNSFPRTILERAKEQKIFEIVNDQIGRPTFTRDIANGFKKLLVRDPACLKKIDRGIFHLANEGSVSWAEFAAFLLKQAGYQDREVRAITSDQLNRPARRPKNSVLCLEKGRTQLGLRLRPWQEAALEFVKEFLYHTG